MRRSRAIRFRSSLLNPVAVKIATKYLPIASADQCGKVTYGIPVTGDEDQYIGRVDWVQNAKHTHLWPIFPRRLSRIRPPTTARTC